MFGSGIWSAGEKLYIYAGALSLAIESGGVWVRVPIKTVCLSGHFQHFQLWATRIFTGGFGSTLHTRQQISPFAILGQTASYGNIA